MLNESTLVIGLFVAIQKRKERDLGTASSFHLVEEQNFPPLNFDDLAVMNIS